MTTMTTDQTKPSLLTRIVRRLRRGLRGAPTQSPVQAAVAATIQRPGFVIVQLGAYIGDTNNDPIFKAVSGPKARTGGSTVLLVEPVREYFEQLRQNYGRLPGVIFENVAVADQPGESKIYRLAVKPEDHGYPEWLSQLSSLKESRMGELWDRYEAKPEYQEFYLKHRIEEPVTCVTFADLMARHGLERVDLLQIDVEGFEYEILKTIDFIRFPIRFLNYERVLLGDDQEKCLDLVRRAGFVTMDHGQDTFCHRPEDAALFRDVRRKG
ncbi:MAG: FkbM family methyltransferase [Verrucomicrobiales bacterium]|nr:FkbM family methyltransferase [Verrucomicrobiales bacterium]